MAAKQGTLATLESVCGLESNVAPRGIYPRTSCRPPAYITVRRVHLYPAGKPQAQSPADNLPPTGKAQGAAGGGGACGVSE